MLAVARFAWPGRKETAMSHRHARILAVGGAAVLVAALAGPAARAAGAAKTWTVQPGGAITAAAGKTTLKDTTTGVAVLCQSSQLPGMLTAGSGLPGAGIGSITGAAYSCPTPSMRISLTPHGLPWRLNLISYNAAAGVARGTVRGLKLTFSILENPSCSFVVNGTSGAAADGVVAVSYSDPAGPLRILRTGGNLHFYHVRKGCLGLVGDGDPATLSATYAVTPAQAITSP
jgi:hypothetical protein